MKLSAVLLVLVPAFAASFTLSCPPRTAFHTSTSSTVLAAASTEEEDIALVRDFILGKSDSGPTAETSEGEESPAEEGEEESEESPAEEE